MKQKRASFPTFIILLLVLITCTACEELKMVLSYRTPLYVEGNCEILPVKNSATPITSRVLTNTGWKTINPYDELPKTFAIHTANKSRVQILMKHHGVLDIQPNTLLFVSSHSLSNIALFQGKCSFIPLMKNTITKYQQLKTTQERTSFLKKIKKKYITKKKGMLFIKSPFHIKTKFSSSIAKKGKTFSIIVDSNHLLHFSKFKLSKLRPSFVQIKNKNSFKDTFKYMAVTGLDIYEHTSSLYFSATAADLTGNWVKLRSYIPTTAFRQQLMRGKRLGHKEKLKTANYTFINRYRKKLRRLKKNRKFRRRYYRRLARQNRQIGFYWKSRIVFRQARAISKAHKRFRKIFGTISAKKLWKGRFIIPTRGVVTSGFGRYRYYYGGRSATHKGIDIAAPVGTSILAPNKGKIVFSGHTPARGNNIVIDHGLGVYTCLFHLAEIFVKKGDIVNKNDIIASMGNTGLSSGSHLHWEMLVNGRRVNPLEWTKNSFLIKNKKSAK